MNEQEIIKIIETLQWKFAKSMPQMPHWYTVRQKNNPELNEMYEKLYYYIRDNHYEKKFYRKTYKYCDIGDYMYWAMTDDITESIIINRALKEKKNDDLQRTECV